MHAIFLQVAEKRPHGSSVQAFALATYAVVKYGVGNYEQSFRNVMWPVSDFEVRTLHNELRYVPVYASVGESAKFLVEFLRHAQFSWCIEVAVTVLPPDHPLSDSIP